MSESAAIYQITYARSGLTFACSASQTILNAARKAGAPMPFRCATGLCGTCKSQKISGDVDMKHQGGIRQREIDQGLFLPCCSRPLGDIVIDR